MESMFHTYRKFFFFLAAVVIFQTNFVFAQSAQQIKQSREVPFTSELEDFYKNYFNHKLSNKDELNSFFTKAVDSSQNFSDEYSKNVHLARCCYFYGQTLMEDYDVSSIEDLDLNDSSNTENVNEIAGKYFDKGIEYANTAVKIKSGSDSLSILSHLISANCTAKNVAYILFNGLKVRSYAKEAVNLDYSNGTAHFLVSAQDAYAPKPFNRAQKARKEIFSYLEDDSIRKEEFDYFNLYSTVGYTYSLNKNYEEAVEWYKKALEIYPENVSTKKLLVKAQNKLVSKTKS